MLKRLWERVVLWLLADLDREGSSSSSGIAKGEDGAVPYDSNSGYDGSGSSGGGDGGAAI